MQGKRTRAVDSRGRAVPGLYVRDGRFIAGAKVDGRWTMKTLDAETLTDARHQRESWLAGLRGIVTRSPVDGLAPSETPKQRNAKSVAVLDAATMERLVEAGTSDRWRVALGLAGYAGLRLGELRALRWRDLDFKAGALTVSCSLLPDGTPKAPKTEAGTQTIPILPALRRLLVAWRRGSALRTRCPTTL